MKKVTKTICAALSWVIMIAVIIVLIFTIITVKTADRNDRMIFGNYVYIVRTDSMKGVFSAGDIIFCKKVDNNELKEGDIITFRSVDPSFYGETITHKIRKKVVDDEGKITFITYGIVTDTDDETPVPIDNVIAKYSFRLPYLGRILEFLKTPTGYITIIVLPMLFMIGYQAYKVYYFVRKYRDEKRHVEQQAHDKSMKQEELITEMEKQIRELKKQVEEKNKTE